LIFWSFSLFKTSHCGSIISFVLTKLSKRNNLYNQDNIGNDNDESWRMKKKGITLPQVIKYAWARLEHYYDDECRVLINFNKNEDDEQLLKTQTLWLQQHFNYESISTLTSINQSMN
jgi:hypothetical protein